MKTIHTFKGSWLAFAILVAIIIGEIAAWLFSDSLGIRANPITVAFLFTGIVLVITSVIYDGTDIG